MVNRERVRGGLTFTAIQLRALALVLSIGLVAAASYRFHVLHDREHGLWLVGVAFVLAALWQIGLRLDAEPRDDGPHRRDRLLLWIGGVTALGGAVLWGWGTYRLGFRDWGSNLDAAWLSWLGGTMVMHLGLDLMWGRRLGAAPIRRWIGPLLLVLLAGAAVYRLGNLADFPGEGTMSQVEDLQTGNWGMTYLKGTRVQWEYLSHAWLPALGFRLLGASEFAMRLPFAVVSVLKTIPLFFWLHWSAGSIGAIVGTTLFMFSGWDTVLSRIPNNHNALVVATAFALLAGPARRGRPSAYVWLGLCGGYVLYEYVAYRPLTFLIVAGAVMQSLRDRNAGCLVRWGRPLLTVVMILSMAGPLFLTHLKGRIWSEYFNGWNRAHAIAPYYNKEDTWEQAIDKRLTRVQQVTSLFFFHGDPSPVKNCGGRPLVDPLTAALLVCGLAYAMVNPKARSPVFGLTAVGFLATVTGSLVLTGSMDIGRAGGSVVYVYVLAGFGAAALSAAWKAAWGRWGRGVALVLLAAGVAAAGVWNTRFLFEYWKSPLVNRAMRSNLAYLSAWLRDNVRADELVVGVAPGQFNVLMPNDAAWIRGRDMKGIVTWDVQAALEYWAAHPGPCLLLLFTGPSTGAVQHYFEGLFPGLTMQFHPDALGLGADIAFAHLPAAPAQLAERLANLKCRGARWTFDIVADTGEVIQRVGQVVPYIDNSTWPGDARGAVFRFGGRVREVRTRFDATFTVEREGPYEIIIETYSGTAEVFLDGRAEPSRRGVPTVLAAGVHTLAGVGTFTSLVVEPSMALSWRGPDSGGQQEIMPLYRVAVTDPSCATAVAAVAN